MTTRSSVISVKAVSKDFILPHQRSGTMKRAALSLVRGNRGQAELQHALQDVSFEIRKGEFFGIVGRNGSGKSTLLKILAGIYQPSRGDIHTDGRLVPFIELGVGFNGELTGRDNVYLSGALLGFSESEINGLYYDIVNFAELERFMDQKLKNYSSGMQVRLAFSVATRAKADILLVDEVLAVGDAAFQRKCFDYFKQLKRSGTTVVFVTHDMDAVREYCDRAILIDNSRLVAEGTAEEIAQRYAQLFMPTQEGDDSERLDDVPASGGGKRWGSGDIHYDSVAATLNSDTTELTIVAKITALRSITAPVLGFVISSDDGENILGTNTLLKRHKISEFKAGAIIKVSWRLPNILADGQYSIGVSAHDVSGAEVYDWWNGSASIRIYREHQIPYPVEPDIKLEINGLA